MLLNGTVLEGGARSGNAVLGSVTSSLGYRNRIVNGDMRIDQFRAGASASVSTGTDVPTYLVDKWQGYANGGGAGIYSAQRLSATPPPGFSNYLRMTVTTADAAPASFRYYVLKHFVEGYNASDFNMLTAGYAISLSFWVRSSITGTFGGSVYAPLSGHSYPFNYTIASANVWTFVSATIPTPAVGTWSLTNNYGLGVSLSLGAGSLFQAAARVWGASTAYEPTGTTPFIATNGATLDFTGVQLEPGPVSTAFEQVTTIDMLRRCQREYAKSFLQATAPVQNAGINTGNESWPAGIAGATAQFFKLTFPVPMRSTSIVTLFNPAAANGEVRDETAAANCSASAATVNSNERGVLITTTGAAGTTVGGRLSVHWTADSQL